MIAKKLRHRTKVGKRNQVTIPAEILRALGVKPGAEIQIDLATDGSVTMSKALDPFAELARLRNSLDYPRLSPEEFELAIEEGQRLRAQLATEKYERSLREFPADR